MFAYVDIPICTGMGSARNNINVLSSDVVIACGTGAGTTSEVMLALKSDKPVLLLNPSEKLVQLLGALPYPDPAIASSPQKAITLIRQII